MQSSAQREQVARVEYPSVTPPPLSRLPAPRTMPHFHDPTNKTEFKHKTHYHAAMSLVICPKVIHQSTPEATLPLEGQVKAKIKKKKKVAPHPTTGNLFPLPQPAPRGGLGRAARTRRQQVAIPRAGTTFPPAPGAPGPDQEPGAPRHTPSPPPPGRARALRAGLGAAAAAAGPAGGSGKAGGALREPPARFRAVGGGEPGRRLRGPAARSRGLAEGRVPPASPPPRAFLLLLRQWDPGAGWRPPGGACRVLGGGGCGPPGSSRPDSRGARSELPRSARRSEQRREQQQQQRGAPLTSVCEPKAGRELSPRDLIYISPDDIPASGTARLGSALFPLVLSVLLPRRRPESGR
ncbi:translation initiation factor IF-2-like [Oxyura jamaicensis]|uniref:translation initiation factor IF-2-like n=1 Tax=Oxyura jamaicensis TaxID=8884 RepID=UPI0015A6BDAE|nr:translation initiation factor IF-2-like [Oxyura jamaicensis]